MPGVGLLFYVFHHIPKAGGSSVRAALGKVLRLRYDYLAGQSPEQAEVFVRNPVDLASLTEGDVLCGHWNTHQTLIWKRYPDLDRYGARKFTLFRPPLETAMSGVRYLFSRGRAGDATPDALLVRRARFISSMFGCTPDNYRDVIDAFWHVGLTSRAQESLDFIADTVGAPRVTVERRNTTDPDAVQFSPSAIGQFMERSRLDQDMYAYAVTLAEAHYARMRA